jgi:phosphohistidine swiveling domain-containing protein
MAMPLDGGIPGIHDGPPNALPVCVTLQALDRSTVQLAGGKAANLGELFRLGAQVPEGFCVTTTAYARVAAVAGIESLIDGLATTASGDPERLAEQAAAIRDRLLRAPVPTDVAQAIRAATEGLGPGAALAVRSSATAEDLPSASFAGQQETFLNVIGPDAVLDAVRHCWASLWTDRAVAYRAAAGVDHRQVQLAVVVQRLVPAQVSGVLFTANPVTGHRGQSVVDASPGLGEAIVSGAVNPDHFVVDNATGAVLERRLGDRRTVVLPNPCGGTQRTSVATAEPSPCLSDAQLAELVALGQRVQDQFGAPQDIEFAFDGTGQLWLLQARPITTLYPLPGGSPVDLRVYLSANVVQGVFRPLTPMGIQAFRLLGSGFAAMLGRRPRDPLAGPPALVEAGGRLFVDITELLRSPDSRRLIARAAEQVEAESGRLVRRLLSDPRLSPAKRGRFVGQVVRLVLRTGLPVHLMRALLCPAAAIRRAKRLRSEIDLAAALPPGATASERLDHAELLLLRWPRRIAPVLMAPVAVGLGSLALGQRLADGGAAQEERDALRRALPHNPTTEMDLALWELACTIRSDRASVAALRDGQPSDLSAAYRAGTLPPALMRGLASFLERYGHRGVAEIDIGVPRWAEDPAPVLASLANYVLRWDPDRAPDRQFRAAAAEAEAAMQEMIRRATRRSRLLGWVVRFLLSRGRELAGLREMPKFTLVYLLARVRALLRSVGAELAAVGRLSSPDDIFFLDLREARAAVAGTDLRAAVRERRALYEREARRRHVPRVVLSNGTDVGAEASSVTHEHILHGTPASAGRVSGRARVVLDPIGAVLEPGDILVAPSTDPGWTPLFLTAGGLVMEMGGVISHGAVVAREFGIPAVVGLPQATQLIRDGQRITVDGTAGTVLLDDAL